jgi:hypothetical protein
LCCETALGLIPWKPPSDVLSLQLRNAGAGAVFVLLKSANIPRKEKRHVGGVALRALPYQEQFLVVGGPHSAARKLLSRH